MSVARDLQLAARAKRAGAHYPLTIIQEARAAGLPISLGFALGEQESGFRNVFGHDPTTSIPESWKGTKVTKSKYAHYRANRARHGMQGVGPCQLTWWATQDTADRLGGCWKPRINFRVAFRTLATNVKTYGQKDGIRRYNGSGPAADRYSQEVRAKAARWHRVLSK